MPEILVIASAAERPDPGVLLRERVCLSDFESAHFCGQLVERIGWAVVDADELERAAAPAPAAPLSQAPQAGRPREARPTLRAA